MSAPTRVTVGIQKTGQGLGLDVPAYQTSGSAGMDLYAAIGEDPLTVEPGLRLLVPTGIIIALPQGYEAQVRPRSGLAFKHGLTVLNAPGTIDADYRGEIGALLINHGQDPFTITQGMRIAQLVIAPVSHAVWALDAVFDGTDRSSGGFGSTGT